MNTPNSSSPTPSGTDAFPPTLQPLSARFDSAEHLAAHARNTVKNVLDSYTGRFDVLAESIQNSMDALEKRWGGNLSFTAESPRLIVSIDAANDEVAVTDNGVGIQPSELLASLVPHMSPKSLDPMPTRGHKGVGTTFLAYGHPAFEIRTKTVASQEVAYGITGGLAWVRNDKVTSLPLFERISGNDQLDDFDSGTSVRISVGDDTRFGRLKTAQYNKLATWALVLRTFTAVGTIAIGLPLHKRPVWLQHLQVDLHLTGTAGAGSTRVPVGFYLPHEDASSAKSLQQLMGVQSGHDRYELLYAEYDNSALEQILAPQLQELAASEQAEDQEILNAFRFYDTSVYASWAYKNTWYEDMFRGRISEEAKRYQYNNVRSGLLVTSVGMPIGEVTDHPYATMKPEYKRRLFVVVGFNEKYSPDLGRKTIPSADRALLRWLEIEVQNLFLKQTARLVKSNDEAPHSAGSFQEAKEQLQVQAQELRHKHEIRQALGRNLGITRAPNFESELAGLFVALVAGDYLPGYSILAIPGSATRYDGLFDFSARGFDKADEEHLVPLGISALLATGGVFNRKGKWLEFKLRLDDLVDDFILTDGDASKKYFDLLDLAVVWAVPMQDAVENFDLHKYDANNWHARNFYGATHWLTQENNLHRLEIISVQDLLVRLTSAA